MSLAADAALETTARSIREKGGRAEVVSADLSDPRSLDAVVAGAARVGQPSILVNAAGVYGPLQLIKDSDPREWIETLMINMVSHYLTCRAFVGGMIDQRLGADRQRDVGQRAAPAGTAAQRLWHEQGGAQPLHPAPGRGGGAAPASLPMSSIPGTSRRRCGPTSGQRPSASARRAEPFLQWADWVEKTGGDDPEKAADLIINLMGDEAASVNGQFLWIKDGLQAPIPSWSVGSESLPWQK